MKIYDIPFPQTEPEFWEMFPNEEACVQYLVALRWPNGPMCSQDGSRVWWRADKRAFQCEGGHLEYLTAGTVMHRSRTPLQLWFLAAWKMATYHYGISALQFAKHVSIGYEASFNILHKLRSGMFDPDQSPLSGRVEVDETFIGGIRKGKRGRGALGKALVIGAMELRKHKSPKKGQSDYYVSRVRYRKIKDASAENIEGFIFDVIDSGSTILTDGFASYQNLDAWDYHHIDMNVRAKSKKDIVPHFHQEVGNLKAWIIGTHHGVSGQHLQTYLNESAYRSNWTYSPFEAWVNMLRLAVSRGGPTYEDISSVKRGGEYAHIEGFDF